MKWINGFNDFKNISERVSFLPPRDFKGWSRILNKSNSSPEILDLMEKYKDDVNDIFQDLIDDGFVLDISSWMWEFTDRYQLVLSFTIKKPSNPGSPNREYCKMSTELIDSILQFSDYCKGSFQAGSVIGGKIKELTREILIDNKDDLGYFNIFTSIVGSGSIILNKDLIRIDESISDDNELEYKKAKVIDDINDILLDITDIGFTIAKHSKFTLEKDKKRVLCNIDINKSDIDARTLSDMIPFKIGEVIDVILRLVDYSNCSYFSITAYNGSRPIIIKPKNIDGEIKLTASSIYNNDKLQRTLWHILSDKSIYRLLRLSFSVNLD